MRCDLTHPHDLMGTFTTATLCYVTRARLIFVSFTYCNDEARQMVTVLEFFYVTHNKLHATLPSPSPLTMCTSNWVF
jgi:hypothetical protein